MCLLRAATWRSHTYIYTFYFNSNYQSSAVELISSRKKIIQSLLDQALRLEKMELDESARAENSSANTSYIAATHGHGSSRNLGKVKIKILSVTNAKILIFHRCSVTWFNIRMPHGP